VADSIGKQGGGKEGGAEGKERGENEGEEWRAEGGRKGNLALRSFLKVSAYEQK